MKKIIALLVILALVAPVAAYADDITTGPVKKLGRGLANVATSPLEITKGMGEATHESGIVAGMTWGLFKGVVGLVKRAAVGVYEVVTFPVPFPKDYEPIIEDPEFFLEERKQ